MSSQIAISANALSKIKGVASFIHSGAVYLFQGPRANLHGAMEEMINRFALRGRVHVVAGGNWVSFDRLPLLLREREGRVYETLDHIQVSRAETCYQMVDVLTWLKPSETPLVITDMLEAFDDDDLTEQEANMLLDKCINQIRLLSKTSPVLISVNALRNRPALPVSLEQIADMRIYIEAARQTHSLQMSMGF